MNRLVEYIRDLSDTMIQEALDARVASGAPKRWRGELNAERWPMKALKAVACFAVIVTVIGAALILPTLKQPLGISQEVLSDLSSHEAVTDIAPYTIDGYWHEYPAYTIKFVSDGLSMNASLVLPLDATKNVPLVFYFPEIAHTPSDLPAKFAAHGFAVVMLDIRGYSQNEGRQDLGGKDFADVLTLYDIMKSSHLFSGSKCLAMGTSYGSIRALRLTAEKGEEISACFVANAFTDILPMMEGKDATNKLYIESLVGATYEEAPEEYELRSAVTFAERFVSPIYMTVFTDNRNYPVQHEGFVAAMAEAGRECYVFEYEGVACNFTIDVMRDLIPHMQSEAGLEREETPIFPADTQPNVAFRLEAPSDELLKRFDAESDAYQKRQPHYDPKYQYPFYIERYYGRFGDIVFLLMGGGGLAYADVITTETVAGYTFQYPDSNTIRVWAYGTFVSLEDAYEQGIITKEQIGVIANGESIRIGPNYASNNDE